MAKETKRWTAEAREAQRQTATTQNLSAQGVAARKAKTRHFNPNPLAEVLGMLTPSTT